MKRDISYTAETLADRIAADARAIGDIAEYLGRPTLLADMVQMAVLTELRQTYVIEVGEQAGQSAPYTFQQLVMLFGISGVEGYPIWAFGRRYCPRAFREWWESDPEAPALDEHGFPIREVLQ